MSGSGLQGFIFVPPACFRSRLRLTACSFPPSGGPCQGPRYPPSPLSCARTSSCFAPCEGFFFYVSLYNIQKQSVRPGGAFSCAKIVMETTEGRQLTFVLFLLTVGF